MAVAAPHLVRTQERTKQRIGTYVTVTLRGPFWLDFNSAFEKAFAAIDKVDSIASVYNKDSEVSGLNYAAHREAVRVSEGLFFLIKESVGLSRNSGGAFDITVAPLVDLWRYYKDRATIPSDSEIKDVLYSVGYGNIILNEFKKTVSFAKEGVSVNLSAIAKGYAVDKAIEGIKSLGFKSAIVNAGGDLYCLGKRDFINGWRIGIIDPKYKSRVIRIVNIHDKAVATSGGYEQYFTYNGKDYSHIIDPKTGYPVERSRLFSVTVIAPTCTLADGIATAVSVGGEAVKKRLKESYPGVEIITVGLN